MIWIFRNIEALDNQIKYCEETNEDDHTKEVVDELDFLCIHNHLFYYALQRYRRHVTEALHKRYECVT